MPYLHLIGFLNDLSRVSKDLSHPVSLHYKDSPKVREDISLARLYRITRQSDPKQLDTLREAVNRLTEERKQLLVELLNMGEFQLYYASELYRKLRKKYEPENKPEIALGIFLDIVIDSYSLAKREFRLPSLKSNNPNIEIRLNFTKLLLDLDRQTDYRNLQISEILNGFEINFR